MMAGLLLAIAVNAAPAEQTQKVSPDNTGFTIQPFANADSGGAALDPTVPVAGPGNVAAVPEPTTIAMLFLGSGCAAAFTALRRRRRG